MSLIKGDVIESEIKPLVKQVDWQNPKPGEDYYSSNQIIAAFEAGVTKGMMGAEQLLLEKLYQNIAKAGVDTRKLVEQLKARNIKLNSARLKVSSWDEFEVLVVLPQEEFIAESFDQVYEIVSELENSSREDHYCISFLFCPEGPRFDNQKVTSDGYTLLHKSLLK